MQAARSYDSCGPPFDQIDFGVEPSMDLAANARAPV